MMPPFLSPIRRKERGEGLICPWSPDPGFEKGKGFEKTEAENDVFVIHPAHRAMVKHEKDRKRKRDNRSRFLFFAVYDLFFRKNLQAY